MRIVWVKANKLLPVSSGGDIRSYNIARQLASHHELTFLSYYDGQPDAAYEQELNRRFPGAVSVCTGKESNSTLARGFDYVSRLPNSAPYAVSRFASAKVREQLKTWFQERRFDVAVCDFLDAAVNFPEKPGIPTVLFQHNVESEIWRRHAETASNPLRRSMYKMEFARMLRYEQEIVERYRHVIAVSEHDKSLMMNWVDTSRVSVVPTGVDLEQYRPDASAFPTEPLVMFVGAMDWEPNIDAMEYFCGEIWPLVVAEVPGAKFRIVGRNPDKRVQKLASKSVEVTGTVASVVDHLRQAAAVIVPLRIGGGTRLKIYEAMAMGKAIVSTSVGAEGLDVHHGRDIVLAEDAKIFAESIVGFLLDRELRSRYEQAAAALAAQYGWPAIGDKFGKVLEIVAGIHRPAAQQYAQV
ncbi:MAG TPA: glycosyltransferase family 4 protein [Terriglobales bacterium]|nr:glycosyltransferase family 4 protein [Terriglobales bacterium]